MPTEPSEHADSPSLDAKLTLTDSETESEEEVPVIKAGDQDEDQDGPNPGKQDEGQDGSNPGDAAESQLQPSHVEKMDEEFTTTAYLNVQENLKLLTKDQVILEEPASSTRTLSSLQNLDKDLSFTNQFFVEKPKEEEPGKTNAEAEVQSMVLVPIHQDTSSVPLMTTPVIDLTKSQSDSLLSTSTATTSIIITTTTLLPPPLQSTTDLILVRRIGELEQHIADLIQNNLVLEERLDKHGSRLYKLENLNIPHQVSKAVDEIVTDAVDWAMQALLRARFMDLPTVDMKEILQQRMFEDNTYKTHEVHNDLYEALQKTVELDYLNQHLADQEEAHKKKRKRRESPRTPPGSPPTQPPPLAGASGALSTFGASGSSQLPSLPPPSIDLSPTDYLMQDDSIPEEQVLLPNDEDSENDHQPKVDLEKDWSKPLPEEERPSTPKPAWTIPSSNKSDVANNWASALATTYEPPAENSLHANIRDMTTFLKCLLSRCHPPLVPEEECHKMLTSQVDWTNPVGDHVRIDVNRPLPLGGPPGHVTIQLQFFFNKDLEYLRYGSKGSNPALSISKMKAAMQNMASLTGGLIDRSSILTDMILRRVEKMSEHTCGFLVSSESKHNQDTDFKNLYPSDFKDLNLLLLQGHLNHLPGSDKQMLSTAVKLWTQNLFSDGTLTRILEALDYRVKEFKVKRHNLGMNMRFWTEKDVTRSKKFIAAIERRLKTRRIYQNLECFVGGRVRDIDYRLLQRME
ncbi:hypothetical protein Tco_0355548 [Tanacetum coccineum]